MKTEALGNLPRRRLIPREVGSRELKTRLGTYLREVQAGATLIVTDRGRPVAQLKPLGADSGDLVQRLRELAAQGVVSAVAQPCPLEPFEPIRYAGPPMSEAIIEDREDRF